MYLISRPPSSKPPGVRAGIEPAYDVAKMIPERDDPDELEEAW